MEMYIGLDVHSKSTNYCIQDSEGTTIGTGEFETTPAGIREFVARHDVPEGTHVGLETGTVSFFVSRLLTMEGVEPIIVDAQEVRRKAHRSRQKSDTRDAEEICRGIRTRMYRSIVHVPPRMVTLIRETLKRRRHFVRIAAKQVTAVKSLLRAAGVRRRAPRLATEKNWEALLKELEPMPELRAFVDQHRFIWVAAKQQVRCSEDQLEEHGAAFSDDILRLQQIPGVGSIVALTILAALSDPSRFPSAKHVASYAGLVPTTSQSGDRDHHGHLTKAGNAELRAMLCEAAHHARRPNNPFHPFFTKITAKRGYKLAVMAVAHRMLRVAWAMLRTGTDFDPRKMGLDEGPFATKKVRRYRLRRTVH